MWLWLSRFEANNDDLVVRCQSGVVATQTLKEAGGIGETVFPGFLVTDLLDGLGDRGRDVPRDGHLVLVLVLGLEHQERGSDVHRIVEAHCDPFAAVTYGGQV